ncbi:hypothetical protein QAD02_017643 [Eretmocerus hayati]|uniref:Uncharacterized protein n=1 Tax=Eretmocerus hayati TaxID=131215 RepID=A0ACC2PGB6_9HYME|nr:hypothetical protein QAD02_017643 [Eretmocerus hayati]
MDEKHKDILKRMRRNIVDDLDVFNGIIPPLTTEYILKEEDVDEIKRGGSREERAEILLDILPKRGPRAFDVFLQSLRHQYDWLSEEIDTMLKVEVPKASSSNNHTSLAYPNLQPVSPLTVTRVEMIKKLKDALRDLQPNGYIALHGMKGFGKSCLTASTLSDKDLTFQLFNNEVYWIKFGYKRDIGEECLIQLNNLYHHIKSTNSILDSVSTEPLEKTLKHLIENHFRQSSHRNALLILDDVCHRQIVDNFDFACKTLVITPDIGVLNKRNHTIVTMDHGFTETETLGLFAKVLDVAVDQLPMEAKLIHDECKGMPLLIAMFAAQFENFKHDMKHHKGRWEYYLNCVRTKNPKNRVIGEFMKIQEATFNMCINQLKAEMREKYENLAIFSEDVNIMPKTLEILWGEQPYSVDDQMLDFCHKSLAAKKWNDDLKSYIYGVHDLLLCHLRKTLSNQDLQAKHKMFVEKYRDYCHGDFSKLPNDNYSLSFIGHHLEQAEMFDEFHPLYTNFDFLQAKINFTSLSDLFIDFKKYRKHITNNGDETIESNLVDLENFLEFQANTLAKQRNLECLDLIQIALDHSDEGYVKDTAKDLAMSRPHSLYLTHERSAIHKNSFLNFDEEVNFTCNTVVFTNEPNYILVGSHDGDVILWDCENRKPRIFSGHNKRYAIKKIMLSPCDDYFLALSEDGTLKLFALDENEFSNGLSIPVQSPRHKQVFWKDFWETTHDDSLKTLSINNEIITDMKFSQTCNKIAACTSSGTLTLWDSNGNFEWQDKYKSHRFGGVAFTTEDNLLHVMDETISVVRIYKKNRDRGYTYLSQFNLQLNNPRIIYFAKHPDDAENCLVIATDKAVVYFKWFSNNNEYIHSYEKLSKLEIKNKNTSYVAASLTYDARYLIVGDSDGIVNIVKAFNPDDEIGRFRGNVTSLDCYWMYNEDFHLICGSENKMIRRWRLSCDQKPNTVKKLLFDARMGNFLEDTTVYLKTSPTTISVCKDKRAMTKIESAYGRIVSMNLRDNASKLVYLTESGSVVIHDLRSDRSMLVSKLDSLESFIDVMSFNNNFVVLCRMENNLQVWRSTKASLMVENCGVVVSAYKISENYVLTVSTNATLKYWFIEHDSSKWQRMLEFRDNEGTIISCSLSKYKSYLAALMDEQSVMIYRLPIIGVDDISNAKVVHHFQHNFKKSLISCEFSPNEKYLAIALDDGEISVIDVPLLMEIGKLKLHDSPVIQLCWSPEELSAPILLSVDSTQMAWWNVSYLRSLDRRENRRSRMGFGRNSNSPSMGMSPRGSVRLPDSPTSPDQQSRPKDLALPAALIDEFWSRKLPKNSAKRPALIGCVSLPASCTDAIKVCVSDDFSQFLTVDGHGTISNYTLFGHVFGNNLL